STGSSPPKQRSIKTKLKNVKQAVRLTKRRVHRSALRSKAKIASASTCIRSSTNYLTRYAKIAIIPSLPGVSKTRLPDPPCPHLLLSNQTPTDAEAELILDAIAQAQAEVTRLTSTLSQTRNTVESDSKKNHGQTSRAQELIASHELSQATIFIHQHQGILSLIRKLPTEILQSIFLFLDQQHPHRFDDAQWRLPEHLPWSLSQTCCSWRTIALHIPRLWNRFPSIQLERSRTTTKLQIQYLRELLRRSAGTLLDICIDATHFNYVEAAEYPHPAVALLCQHAERWETATLILRVHILAGLQSLKGRLTALKSLSLSARVRTPTPLPSPGDTAIASSLDAFCPAPLLTTVHLARPFLRSIPLPYEQIKHYKESLDFGHSLTPAIRSSQLETLTLLVLTHTLIFPPGLTCMPRLVELHVDFLYKIHNTNNCFDGLSLPVIQDIRIQAPQDNLAPTLLCMLQNSSPCLALTTLAIRFGSIEPGQLTSLLELTPELVHLHATLPVDAGAGTGHGLDVDIHNLANSSGQVHRVLVPLLETCEFYYEDDYHTTKISTALNILALSRCELPPQSVESPILLAGDPGAIRRLTSLSLSFSGPESSRLRAQHSRLDDWFLTTTSFDLAILRDTLVAKLPDLLHYGYHEQGGLRSWSENDKVGKILAEIDAVRVDHARDIYASGVHYTLKGIATCQCAGTKNGALAQKILDKWKPMTEDPNTLRHRHWAMQGDRSLVYIPNDSGKKSIFCGVGLWGSTLADWVLVLVTDLRTESPGDIILGPMRFCLKPLNNETKGQPKSTKNGFNLVCYESASVTEMPFWSQRLIKLFRPRKGQTAKKRRDVLRGQSCGVTLSDGGSKHLEATGLAYPNLLTSNQPPTVSQPTLIAQAIEEAQLEATRWIATPAQRRTLR
ncbi:hypothetical protein CVT25_015464, partial [Psilocybe cyanescens]